MSDDDSIDIDKPGQRRVNVNDEDVKLHIFDEDEYGQAGYEERRERERLGEKDQ
jgi:hypothetical protein